MGIAKKMLLPVLLPIYITQAQDRRWLSAPPRFGVCRKLYRRVLLPIFSPSKKDFRTIFPAGPPFVSQKLTGVAPESTNLLAPVSMTLVHVSQVRNERIVHVLPEERIGIECGK